MPRGGARIGAGRKPKPLAQHLLEGTFVPGRHGHLLARAATVSGPAWVPRAEDLAALEPRARELVSVVLGEFALCGWEGSLLLEAARCLSRVERLEAELAVDGLSAGPNPVLASIRGESRLFLGWWAALRLPESRPVPEVKRDWRSVVYATPTGQ